MIILCGRCLRHFSWQAQYFVDLNKIKKVSTIFNIYRVGEASVFTFWIFIFCMRYLVKAALWSLCACLLSLWLGARLISFAQPSRLFVSAGSPSLWRGEHFDIGCATVWSLCTRPIALVVVCAHFDITCAILSSDRLAQCSC